MKITSILRDWALVLAIVAGVCAYLLFAALPFGAGVRAAAAAIVSVVQPALIFCMLLLTFCRIDIRQLRLCRWHLWLLLVQGGAFVGLALALLVCKVPAGTLHTATEAAMLCLICPTATAAAVITRRLGGSLTQVTAYTILINVLASVLVPALVPYIHPVAGMSSLQASLLILGRVMPLLLLPLVVAIALKRLAPAVHRKLSDKVDLSFSLWVVALALAMVVTTRSVCRSTVGAGTELWIGAVSALCCLGQFWLGRRIGRRYGHDCSITAGQALGQKNTVVAIWMGYTFFTPITALAGGFYSIWHNLVNSYQLMKSKHSTGSADPADPAAAIEDKSVNVVSVDSVDSVGSVDNTDLPTQA